MRHAVVTKPKLIGCLNCSPIPPVRLPKNRELGVGFGSVDLEVDGELVFCAISEDYGNKTVRWLERKYKDVLQTAECVTLQFNTPLHDETYEYNKENGEWYLIAQGMGFA